MSQFPNPQGGQGAAEPKKSNGCAKAAAAILLLIILLIGGCVFLRGIFHSHAKHTEPAGPAATPPIASASAPPPTVARATPKPPSYEEWFIASCRQYETGVPAEGNAPQIAYLRGERSRGISNSLPGVRTLSGWTGTLRKAQATVDGKLAIAIELPDSNILLQTWGDALSDAGAGTLIEKKSELYDRLRNLAIGTPVSFDGDFLADKDDWVKEGSKTGREGLISPKFIVRFKDVKSLGK